MSPFGRIGTIVSLVFVGACASVPTRGGFDDVAKVVNEREGKRVHWKQGDDADREAQNHLKQLLAQPLTPDSAVQIALLNNPGLQATLEDLGISQADVVQAGLLKNPSFGFAFLSPLSGGGPAKTAFSVTEELVDLFLLPLRKRVANAQFEAVKVRVADTMIALAAETRAAFYTIQGAQQLLELRRTLVESMQISAELAQKQLEAGNVSELVAANEISIYEQARLDLQRSEVEALTAREHLTRLLGVWGTDAQWKIEAQLQSLPAEEVSLEHLESLAIAQRLDLEAARREWMAAGHALSLTANTRWLGSLRVGAGTEREAEGGRFAGPELELELPVFDQQQAQIARLQAARRQSEQRMNELAVNIRSEVRTIRGRLVASRQIVEHYRKILLPLREKIVTLSQEQYNAMLIGVFQLLTAKQNEINTYREYIDAVRDYWIARAELQRAVGGRLEGDAR